MHFFGQFNDGRMIAAIMPHRNGDFLWKVDNQQGILPTFDEAFYNEMPEFLANPDDFEDHSDW